MGRPKLENPLTVISVRVPTELVIRIDGLAQIENVKRGELVRRLLDDGLDRLYRNAFFMTLKELNRTEAYGGRIPVAAIQCALPGYDDLDEMLLDIETHGRVQLEPGDPRATGFEVRGRGKLTLVVLKSRNTGRSPNRRRSLP